MPISPYPRNAPESSPSSPNDLTLFSRVIPSRSLCVHQKAKQPLYLGSSAPQTYYPHLVINQGGVNCSELYGRGDSNRANLFPIRYEMVSSVSVLRDAYAFMPYGSIYFPGMDCLVEESLWHSTLFYSDHFRCERRTDWSWRTRNELPACDSWVSGNSLFAYHCFYWHFFHWFCDSFQNFG